MTRIKGDDIESYSSYLVFNYDDIWIICIKKKDLQIPLSRD